MTHTQTAATTTHPFEKAGLGTGPYTFVRFERVVYQAIPGDPNCPVQPGGCCDYCSTGIYDFYWVRNSEGQLFKVGSTCIGKIAKVYKDRVISEIQREVNRVKRERKNARDRERIADTKKRLATDAIRDTLSRREHPRGLVNRETNVPLTFLDWAEWMMDHAGVAGMLRVCRIVDELEKNSTDFSANAENKLTGLSYGA